MSTVLSQFFQYGFHVIVEENIIYSKTSVSVFLVLDQGMGEIEILALSALLNCREQRYYFSLFFHVPFQFD